MTYNLLVVLIIESNDTSAGSILKVLNLGQLGLAWILCSIHLLQITISWYLQ